MSVFYPPLHVIEEAGTSAAQSNTVGVDQFWLIALKNCDIFADVIKVGGVARVHDVSCCAELMIDNLATCRSTMNLC